MADCCLKVGIFSTIFNYLPIHPHNEDADVNLKKKGVMKKRQMQMQ
jgi:hypothetical protein